MKDEYFDIVDENNKPTGKKELRSKAHTAGLWHRTVHIYFFRQSESGLDFLAHLFFIISSMMISARFVLRMMRFKK